MSIFQDFAHIVRENEPLAPYTWARVGGTAKYFAEPTSVEELQALVRRCASEGIAVRVLGAGSSIIVRDEGVAALVVSLAAPAFCAVRIEERTVLAGAGVRLGHVIATAVREGLAGLEGFVGIPGTVGGAVYTNVVSHGTCISQWTEAATVVTADGSLARIGRQQLELSRRGSHLDQAIIVEAEFRLEPGDPRLLTQRMQHTWIVRRASQPPPGQTTLCMFEAPGWTTASALIEQIGLQGTRVRQAELFDKDPNFVVIHPGATCRDVVTLMQLVQDKVREKFGVELEPAIEIW